MTERPLVSPGPFDVLWLVVSSALLGSSFTAIKVAVRSFSPVEVATARIAIAAVVVGLYAVLRASHRDAATQEARRASAGIRTLAQIALVGLLGFALPFVLISWAEQRLPSAVAGILMSAGPIFALLLAPVVTGDETVTRRTLWGAVLGLSGVLMVLVPRTTGEADDQIWYRGLAVLGAALCYVLAGFLIRRVRVTPDTLTAGSLAVAAVLLLPLALWGAPTSETPRSAAATGALVYLGLVPTALAYMIRARQVVRHGYTFVSNNGYLVPIWSVFWGAILLSEELSWNTTGGLAVVVIGIWVAHHRR